MLIEIHDEVLMFRLTDSHRICLEIAFKDLLESDSAEDFYRNLINFRKVGNYHHDLLKAMEQIRRESTKNNS